MHDHAARDGSRPVQRSRRRLPEGQLCYLCGSPIESGQAWDRDHVPPQRMFGKRMLQWSQIDRDRHVVRLEPGTTKNKKGRTLPYRSVPELVKVVEAAWKEHERLKRTGAICPHVFHRNGKAIRHFRKAWAKACETAGCPGKLLHDFRRTAVRNLVRAGVPEKTAMGVTGHKTRSVFDRYDIVNEADLDAALGKLVSAPIGASAKGKIKRFARRAS